jgi:hypothetical protein
MFIVFWEVILYSFVGFRGTSCHLQNRSISHTEKNSLLFLLPSFTYDLSLNIDLFFTLFWPLISFSCVSFHSYHFILFCFIYFLHLLSIFKSPLMATDFHSVIPLTLVHFHEPLSPCGSLSFCEDEGSRFLQNVGSYLLNHTVPHPRRQ